MHKVPVPTSNNKPNKKKENMSNKPTRPWAENK